MGFESTPQPEKKLSEAEMAQEARAKAEQATQRPEGESAGDEWKRANELLVETKRAEMLANIANMKEDVQRLQENVKSLEGDPTKTIMADNLREKIRLTEENIKQKEKEYQTWDKIERTGSPI